MISGRYLNLLAALHAAIESMETRSGFAVYHPPMVKPRKHYPRLDCRDFVEPVNVYQVKQRQQKAKRKGKVKRCD